MMVSTARVLLLTTILVASAADAQWRIDLSGGALVMPWAVDLQHAEILNDPAINVRDFSTTARFETGGTYAVGARYAITEHLELGGQFEQSLSRDADRLPNSRGSVTRNAALDIFSVTFGTRIHLLSSDHRFRPWLIAEGGWYRANAQIDEVAVPVAGECFTHCPFGFPGFHHSGGPDDGFGFNVGTGFDFALTPWLSIGPDVRYHHAVNVLGNLDFVTTSATVGFHF